MISLEQMRDALGDPAVKQWGHRVIESAREAGHELSVDEGRLHKAIEETNGFHGNDGEILWWEFWQAYGAAISGSNDLAAQSQSFTAQFRIFRQDPKKVLAEDFYKHVDSILIPRPSEFDVASRFRNIARVSEELKKQIEVLGGVLKQIEVLGGVFWGGQLRERLDLLCADLEQVVQGNWRGASDDRERLFEIGGAIKGAGDIVAMSKTEFAEAVPHLLRNMMFAFDFASERMKQRLGQLRISLVKELSLPDDGDDLSSHFGRAKRAAAEAFIHTSEILWIALHTGIMPSAEEFAFSRPNGSSLEALSDAAFRIMSRAGPQESLKRIGRLTKDLSLTDAAAIDAALRRRFGDGSEEYASVLGPYLRRGIHFSAVPDEPSDDNDDFKNGTFFSYLKSRLDRVPMHLEFSSGRSPAGLDLAAKLPDSMVFFIDPFGVEVREEQLSRIGFMPNNFTAISGRGEEIVPFAFNGPFAESALMVEPPSNSFSSLLLSALLAVKPGGMVRIWRFLDDSEELDFLTEAGFGVSSTVLDGKSSSLPPGDYFDEERPVEFVRISVPMPGENRPEEGGGPFIRVFEGGQGMPRSVTRKRIIKAPVDSAASQRISSGLFAGQLSMPGPAVRAVSAVSLLTNFRIFPR